MQDKIEKLREIKILFVEDEAELLLIMESTLEKLKCNFITVSNGLEALNVLETNNDIQVVVTDLNMPLMNGVELIKTMHEKNIDIPIVVMSAYLQSTYLEEVKKLGVEDYLYKPFDFMKFIDLIVGLKEK